MIWEGPAAILMPLAFFVGLGLTCWAWGEALLRKLGDEEDSEQRWATASALGVGVFAQGLFLLGLLDLYDSWALAAYVALGHAIAATTGIWRSASAVLRRTAPFAAASLPTIAISLYPPIGFDATVYHLPYATSFLELGGLAFLPELRFPVFAQLAEVAFVPAVLWVGDVGAQLCQALCLLIGGGVVYRWGRNRGDANVGRLCAALWFGLPLAVWIGAQAYVDVELALFVAAGAAAVDRKHPDRNRPGLAGVFLGFAAATKYLGLFFLAAFGVLVLLKSRDRIGAGIKMSAGSLAVAGPWYLRLVVLTGNPLFPFYPQIFGESDWSQGHRVELTDVGGGAADAALRLFTLPWDGVFGRERFHFEAPVSPWYLLLVPLLVWAVWSVFLSRRRRVEASVRDQGDIGVRWLIIVGLYGLFWLTTQGEIRFWLPALPLLHLPIALALRCVLPNRVQAATAALLLAPGLVYGVYKLVDLGPVPLTEDARRAHLSEHVPGYDAIDFLNQLEEPGGVYGLHAERLRHYSERPFVGDWFGPDGFARFEALTKRPEELRRALDRRGIRYLVLPSDQVRHSDLSAFLGWDQIFAGISHTVLDGATSNHRSQPVSKQVSPQYWR